MSPGRPGNEPSVQQLSFGAAWQAPLPPPNAFAEYDRILPGASERILRMAEKDLDGKLEQDRKVTDAIIGQSKTGLWLAGGLAGGSLAASIGFLAVGDDIAGGILLGMPIVLLVRSFLQRSSRGDS